MVNQPRRKVRDMFYEGAEKKVEVVVNSGSKSLRSLGYKYWQEIVKACHAEILSFTSSDQVDAYLLSESSLFVWDSRFMIITCGETVLVNSLITFINDNGADSIESVTFQRENEARAENQKTTFSHDISMLSEFVSGSAIRLGEADNAYSLIYSLDKTHQALENDSNSELQLCGLNGKYADYFLGTNIHAEAIRDLLRIDDFFAEYTIDDHVFTPYGYSLNGVREDKYITIHITPQREASYISFKSNDLASNQTVAFQKHLINLFDPRSVRTTSFNSKLVALNTAGFSCQENIKKFLANGLKIEFNNYQQQPHSQLCMK